MLDKNESIDFLLFPLHMHLYLMEKKSFATLRGTCNSIVIFLHKYRVCSLPVDLLVILFRDTLWVNFRVFTNSIVWSRGSLTTTRCRGILVLKLSSPLRVKKYLGSLLNWQVTGIWNKKQIRKNHANKHHWRASWKLTKNRKRGWYPVWRKRLNSRIVRLRMGHSDAYIQ